MTRSRHGRATVALRACVAILVSAVLVSACQLWRNSASEPLGEPAAGSIRIATHNVHYILLEEASGAWSVGDWERRKGPLDAAFKALDADIIAFQEMESFDGGDEGRINLALDWLLESNPDYAAGAVGDPRTFPSTQPILYRRARFALLEQGWFFFSETPEVIYSPTFDGSYPAFASWARFRERDGATPLTVLNVHTDFRSFSNRRRSIELVADRVATLIDSGEAVVLGGDLNARLGSANVATLEESGLSFLPVSGSTFHFNRGINLFGAIDHLAFGPGVRSSSAPMVLRRKFQDEWPSDHYPLAGDFLLE